METALENQQADTAHESRWKGWGERNMRFALIIPTTLFIFAISIFPQIYSLGISFLDWDLHQQEPQFIGLENYSTAVADTRLWEAVAHTLVIVVAAVMLELILGFVLAYILSEKLPGKNFIIPIFILPVVMAPIIVGYTWRMLWDTQFGPINQVLSWILGEPITLVWLTNPVAVYPAIIITEIWQWTPFMFLILLAGLTAINPEIREAASMDGASGWQSIAYITLPLLKPVIVLAIIFRALDVFKLFDIVFALTGGGPGSYTETVSLYVYILGFKNFRLSYTAAVSIILLIIVAFLITILWKRLGEEEQPA